ncbi:MAG: hypothetical protein QNJ94_08850 [Alphaproteobacteria bacterium]|nr:hypothetical protein [Alphaproteobacteria bacterium]
MARYLLGALLLTLLAAGGASADGADPALDGLATSGAHAGPADDAAPEEGSALSRLSPGNRKIARSLFAAQPGGEGEMTLEEIAAARLNGTGWGRLFRRMKSAGLVQAKNLGEIISSHAHEAAGGRQVAVSTAGTMNEPSLDSASSKADHRADLRPTRRIRPIARGKRPTTQNTPARVARGADVIVTMASGKTVVGRVGRVKPADRISDPGLKPIARPREAPRRTSDD